MLGAALSLASCSRADRQEGADWREGVESREDCIARMNVLSEELISQPAARHFRWVPVFQFDVTRMSKDAVDELVASTGAHVMTPSEPGYRAGEAIPDALLYRRKETSLFRLRGRPVAMADVTEVGCALQRPGMRLISWDMQPPPK
ncbi:MAG TPA: hypothetical protein VI168_06320 [Croceibacterium sp.]